MDAYKIINMYKIKVAYNTNGYFNIVFCYLIYYFLCFFQHPFILFWKWISITRWD